MGERFEPVPLPYLNSMPSVLARPRIDSIVSSTLLMKQAEHCGLASTPTLNHTGELNAMCWCSSSQVSSPSKMRASSSLAKYTAWRAHCPMVPTTRPISWRTLYSRSGVFRVPRKYLETTTAVAVCDQEVGNSTPFCSKIVSPLVLVMAAVRRSHATSSNGLTPGLVCSRVMRRPGPRSWRCEAGRVTPGALCAATCVTVSVDSSIIASSSPSSSSTSVHGPPVISRVPPISKLAWALAFCPFALDPTGASGLKPPTCMLIVPPRPWRANLCGGAAPVLRVLSLPWRPPRPLPE